MTKQEILDKVAKHLLTQNQKSTRSPDRVCQYRGDNGLMCAIGCLIPDDKYTVEFEGWGVPSNPDHLAEKKPAYAALLTLLKELFGEASFPLLARLQAVHDDQEVADWPAALAETAEMFNLEVTW